MKKAVAYIFIFCSEKNVDIYMCECVCVVKILVLFKDKNWITLHLNHFYHLHYFVIDCKAEF
jgi:hypothetical protein